jgi:hypothetical protein
MTSRRRAFAATAFNPPRPQITYMICCTQRVRLFSGSALAELDQILRRLIELLVQRNDWHLSWNGHR